MTQTTVYTTDDAPGIIVFVHPTPPDGWIPVDIWVDGEHAYTCRTNGTVLTTDGMYHVTPGAAICALSKFDIVTAPEYSVTRRDHALWRRWHDQVKNRIEPLRASISRAEEARQLQESPEI